MRGFRVGLAVIAVGTWLVAVVLVFWHWHADLPYRAHTCGSLIAPHTWDGTDVPCMEARNTAAGWAILCLAIAVAAGAGWATLVVHQRRATAFRMRMKAGQQG